MSNWKIQRHPRRYWSTQAQTADSPPSRSRAYICLSSPAKLPSCQNMTHARNTRLASAFPGLEWSTVQHQERRKRRAASSGTGRLHRALEKKPSRSQSLEEHIRYPITARRQQMRFLPLLSILPLYNYYIIYTQ